MADCAFKLLHRARAPAGRDKDVLQPREAPASRAPPAYSLRAAQCAVRFAASHGIQCDSQGGSGAGITGITSIASIASIACTNATMQLRFVPCDSAEAGR